MEAILIGGFVEIIELCDLCRVNILGVIDKTLDKNFCGYPVLGNDADAPTLARLYRKVPLIVTPDTPATRKKIANLYAALGFSFASLISPKADVSKSARIGEGVIIQSGVSISSNVSIDNFVHVNVRANIMHDCTIEAFATIAPNAVLLGRVRVGQFCYIGANSTIMPDVTIHERSVVGAGAVVVKDVSENKRVKGVPAR
ncbi:hexapeptide transferase [bacterium]|nr:hexapeptide transferase [bacterium]